MKRAKWLKCHKWYDIYIWTPQIVQESGILKLIIFHPNLNNMLTLITKSTCCTHHYTYHDSGPASQCNMIISKNISISSMAAYHDIFHQHHLICWWRSALTSSGVAHIWIYHLIILHCSWSWWSGLGKYPSIKIVYALNTPTQWFSLIRLRTQKSGHLLSSRSQYWTK